MRGQRVMDWRFFVALGACLMVGYLVIGGYQDNVAKGKRIDDLIHSAIQADARAARDAQDASVERQQLLDNQRRLLRLYRVQVRNQAEVEARLDRLRAYLAAMGIRVPDDFQAGNHPGRRPSSTPQTGKPSAPAPKPEHPPSPPQRPGDILQDLLGLLTPKGTP